MRVEAVMIVIIAHPKTHYSFWFSKQSYWKEKVTGKAHKQMGGLDRQAMKQFEDKETRLEEKWKIKKT